MAAATAIPRSGPAVRAALAESSPAECAQFEEEFAAALLQAHTELDLAPADSVLDRWWGVATIRTNPLEPDEKAQLNRARRGELAGLWERDRTGGWIQH